MDGEGREKQSTVCVLLSTYNGEEYLRPLLDSVLAQNDGGGQLKISLFVRDDGSADGTVDILKEYADRGALTLASYGESNVGFAKSFSRLLQGCPQSDYYAFCDQDDVWLPDKLLHAVRALEKTDSTKPALYSTSLIVVKKDLKEITRNTHSHLSRETDYRFEECVLQNNTYGCTMVFNESLRKLYLRVPEGEIRFHDYMLTVLAAGLGEFLFEDDPQILYRQHGHNTVGFYKGSLINLIHSAQFFFKNDMKGKKFMNVKVCKEYFYDLLPPARQKFLDDLYYYKQDKAKKKELLKFIKHNIKEKFTKRYNSFLIRHNKF